jgi:hypothetical protein
MKNWFSKIRTATIRVSPTILSHLLYLGGLAAVARGFWMLRPWIGFVIGGLLAVWLATQIDAESKPK